jgi:hypothetical protein
MATQRMIYLSEKEHQPEENGRNITGHSRNEEDEGRNGVTPVDVQDEVLTHPCYVRIPGGHTMSIGNKESQTKAHEMLTRSMRENE